MIDAARVLRDQARAEAEQHEAEAGRLWSFVAELDAFIDQPGSVIGRADPGVAGNGSPASPVMATCPDCSTEVKAVGLGTHRRQKHGRGRPTTLVKPPPPEAPVRPAPSGTPATHRCSCGRAFPFVRGLSRHRNYTGHATADPARPIATAVAEPSNGVAKDPREIDEECPRGCGRRFRWEPSLLNHVKACKGPKED